MLPIIDMIMFILFMGFAIGLTAIVIIDIIMR